MNTIENRITFKIKTGSYLGLLTPETIKLLGSAKNKITKNKNGEHLEITEVVLVHCSIFNKYYEQDSRALFNICSKQIIWSGARTFVNKVYLF